MQKPYPVISEKAAVKTAYEMFHAILETVTYTMLPSTQHGHQTTSLSRIRRRQRFNRVNESIDAFQFLAQKVFDSIIWAFSLKKPITRQMSTRSYTLLSVRPHFFIFFTSNGGVAREVMCHYQYHRQKMKKSGWNAHIRENGIF